MKVKNNDESELEFDNGLKIVGDGDVDCCAHNYIDFEQFPVGTKFPDMDAQEFVAAITIKEDGFSIKDSDGIPKWAQARSVQNGYYSSMTSLMVIKDKIEIQAARLFGKEGY